MTPYYANWAWTKANLVSLGLFGLVFWAWGGPLWSKMCSTVHPDTNKESGHDIDILLKILGSGAFYYWKTFYFFHFQPLQMVQYDAMRCRALSEVNKLLSDGLNRLPASILCGGSNNIFTTIWSLLNSVLSCRKQALYIHQPLVIARPSTPIYAPPLNPIATPTVNWK